MKKFIKYCLYVVAITMTGVLGACSEFKPETPELPDLPKVSNLKADVSNRIVNLSWTLPSTSLKIEGVTVKVNNNINVDLDATATTYTVKGQPMEDEYMYTVKLRYEGGYVSEGVSTIATVPFEKLAELTEFKVASQEKRSVTFSWTLPNAAGITGVLVGLDGHDNGTLFNIADYPTGATLNGNETGVDLKFRAQVVYDDAYYSDGLVVNTALPEMEVRTGFLLLADNPSMLPDDDERVAAEWFYDTYVDTDKGDFIKVADLPSIDYEEYGVIWIMVDRIGMEMGWANLPQELVNDDTMNALRAYGLAGGSLFLSNMATQLTEPLGIVPNGYAPNIFSSGEGGSGDDVWVINPYLGWDFQNNPDIDFYDRTAHKIYEGITLEDPNGYGYNNLPLIGPGQREDHNCMWDCNVWGNGGYNNSVKNFEMTTNSLVLATWGHVRDHCVAGLVEFYGNTTHGTCIACGFAAYEWNQNSGINPYQGNVEKLTENILNYLK